MGPRTDRSTSEAELLEAIRDVSHTVVARLMPQAISEGLNAPTFWHLHHLERSGVKHPGELARRLGITAAACTWSVDQLVGLGLVDRHPSEADRRQIVLAVTPKGKRTLAAVWRRFDASLESALATLPPQEVAVTARTLRTLATHLRLETAAPVPGARP